MSNPEMKGAAGSTYRSALQELYGLGKFGIKLGLHNIFSLLKSLDDPHHTFPSIHVAGSNGKGSTAACLAAVLQAAGFRVGLYTSPHLVDFRERIRVDGKLISPGGVVRLWKQVRPRVRELKATYFEAVTAMAFEHFRARKVDVAVVEVGLGGRLDATNVLLPDVAVITNISREHTQWLGTRLDKIAREKAGIVKEGIPVVCAETRKTPLEAIRRICRRQKAPLHLVDEELSWEVQKVSPGGTDLLVKSPGEDCGQLHLSLAGRHQVRNGMTALLTVQILRNIGWKISFEAVRTGFNLVNWPGRLQVVRESPLVLLDVAHNPAGSKALSVVLRELLPDKKIRFVFGVQEDKEHGVMIKYLAPLAEEFYLTQAQWKGAEDPQELAREVKAVGVSFRVHPRVKDAVRAAVTRALCPDDIRAFGQEDQSGMEKKLEAIWDREVVCITGSHFVVGEAMEVLGVRA